MCHTWPLKLILILCHALCSCSLPSLISTACTLHPLRSSLKPRGAQRSICGIKASNKYGSQTKTIYSVEDEQKTTVQYFSLLFCVKILPHTLLDILFVHFFLFGILLVLCDLRVLSADFLWHPAKIESILFLPDGGTTAGAWWWQWKCSH